MVRALVGATADWDAMLRVATAHRVAPMLLSTLRAHQALDRLPVTIRRPLEQQYVAAAARGTRLQTELLRILRRLAELNIETLPVRGPSLALQLYPDPVGRQSDDLDLLVRREDLPRAKAALQVDGYAPVEPVPPAIEALRLAAGGACVLQQAGSSLQVDLAWTLFPRHFARPLTLEDLTAHRRIHRIDDQPVATLDHESWLILLCAHGAKHLWSRHAWTLDVAMLMARYHDWQWDAVLHRAQSLGFARMLLLGLAWNQQTCGTPLPDRITAAIARDAIVARLCHVLTDNFERDPTWFPGDDWNRAKFQYQVRERGRDRWRYVWRRALMPTPNDWRTCPLPASLWPLYMVLRPLRLATRTARRRLRPST